VEISSGKWSSVVPAPRRRKRMKSVHMAASMNVHAYVTSLNVGIRKKETERIERENHAFAKRLFEKKAILPKK